jgi:predicted membrane protein
MFTERELQTNAEDVVNQRAMNATLTHANGTTLVNGTTDISGNVFFDFENVIVSAGDTIVVLSEAIDDQTLTLADDDVAFRWRDETSTIKGDPGPLIGSGLRNFLILLAAVVVIVLAYMGYQKVRQKQELKKAYQQTERKRARRKP